MHVSRIAIIGAGMAGLACAQALHARGTAVTIFDKGRRPGGRLATRRIDGIAFNHGAQFATAREEPFQRFLAEAGDAVAPWDRSEAHPRWVGVPGMSALAGAAEQAGIGTLVTGRQVSFISRSGSGWHLRHLDAAATRPGVVIEDGDHAGPFDRLVLALPPSQAASLLFGLGHGFAGPVGAIRMQPCWALMLAFAERQPGCDRQTYPAPASLSWIARDSSRPGRTSLPDCWVAHASADWSQAHLDDAADDVQAALHQAFRETTGVTAPARHAAVHRWRFAHAARPLGQPVLSDPNGIAVCGDWCLGGNVEAAFSSGLAAAAACLDGVIRSVPG